MRKYSTIVSGSTVLHLFCPSEDWNPNDLDLFVSWDCLATDGLYVWHSFLTNTCGYLLQRSREINPTFPSARVFDYVKETTLKIQLHVTDLNPIILVIDRFNASLWKNYATADKAYCLFPDLTLNQHRMTLFRCSTVEQLEAIEKYKDRGFDIVSLKDIRSNTEVASDRYTGDSLCQIKHFSAMNRPDREHEDIFFFHHINGQMRVHCQHSAPIDSSPPFLS
jgi:hypothetical protein